MNPAEAIIVRVREAGGSVALRPDGQLRIRGASLSDWEEIERLRADVVAFLSGDVVVEDRTEEATTTPTRARRLGRSAPWSPHPQYVGSDLWHKVGFLYVQAKRTMAAGEGAAISQEAALLRDLSRDFDEALVRSGDAGWEWLDVHLGDVRACLDRLREACREAVRPFAAEMEADLVALLGGAAMREAG